MATCPWCCFSPTFPLTDAGRTGKGCRGKGHPTLWVVGPDTPSLTSPLSTTARSGGLMVLGAEIPVPRTASL